MFQKLKENYTSIFKKYPALSKLALVSLMAEVGYSTVIPTLPLYFTQELKSSVSLFGFVIASYAFTETVLKVPSGYFADRIGRKIFITAGSIIPGVAIFSCVFLKNPYYFIPVWGLVGVAASFLWPNLIAKTSEIVKEEEKAHSLAVFNAAYMIGLCIGPPLGTIINKIFNFKAEDFHIFIFFLSSLFFIISGLIAFFYVPSEKPAPVSKIDSPLKNFIKDISKIFKMRFNLRIIFLISFLQMFAGGILSPVIIIYANNKIGISEEAIRMMFLPLGFFLAVFSLPVGKFVDRIGKIRSIKLSLLILSIVFYTVGFFKNIFILIFYVMIVGISVSFLIPAWLSIISREKEKGVAIGTAGTAQSIGFVLGPVFGGYLYEHIGIIYPFIFSAIVLTLCLVLNIIYLKEENNAK